MKPILLITAALVLLSTLTACDTMQIPVSPETPPSGCPVDSTMSAARDTVRATICAGPLDPLPAQPPSAAQPVYMRPGKKSSSDATPSSLYGSW